MNERLLLPLAVLLLATACAGTSTTGAAPAPSASAAPTSASSPSLTPTPASAAPSSPTPSATAWRMLPSNPPAESPRPIGARSTLVFPIRGCAVTYGRSHHDYPATDMFAARGCTVVAPIDGRVDEVSTVDRWSSGTNRGADRGGLSWSIVGTDGVRYYGSHLATLSVRAGQGVAAGQVLGTVGSTGSAKGTSPHLHFGLSWPTKAGIWWVRRGEVYPWPYLDSWKAGGSKSPVAAVAAERQRQGDVPTCRAAC